MTDDEKRQNELQFLTDIFANAISVFAKRNPGQFVGNMTLENTFDGGMLTQTVKLDAGEVVQEGAPVAEGDDAPVCINQSIGLSSDFRCGF